MLSIARLVGFLVPVAVLAGCSHLGIGRQGDAFNEPDAPVTVVVRNHNFNDATVWVITRGDRMRLGTVTGKTDASFRVPARMPADAWYVEINLIGGDFCRTEEILVDPGDVLDLQIATEVSHMPGCYPPGRGPRR